MARKRKGLGERHHRIMQVLERFTDQNGYPPSIREIGRRANISSTSVVNYYLDQLEEDGYIERDRNVSRGVRLLKRIGGLVEDMLKIPVVGRIVASAPVPVPPSDFPYFDEESMVEVARLQLDMAQAMREAVTETKAITSGLREFDLRRDNALLRLEQSIERLETMLHDKARP